MSSMESLLRAQEGDLGWGGEPHDTEVPKLAPTPRDEGRGLEDKGRVRHQAAVSVFPSPCAVGREGSV